jgi:hypothetical protein
MRLQISSIKILNQESPNLKKFVFTCRKASLPFPKVEDIQVLQKNDNFTNLIFSLVLKKYIKPHRIKRAYESLHANTAGRNLKLMLLHKGTGPCLGSHH